MFCWGQVFGVQLALPHWFELPPPPQFWLFRQVPQSSVAPQPSGTRPQLAFSCWQVLGVQVGPLHVLGMPEHV